MLSAITEMEMALQSVGGDLSSGLLNELLLPVEKSLNNLGITLKGSDAREKISYLHAQVFPSLRPIGSGSTSDWEGSVYSMAFPGVGYSPEVLREQLNYMKSRIQRDEAYSAFVDRQYSEGRSMADINDEWKAKVDRGDADTSPTFIRLDTTGDTGFTDEAIQRMGGFNAGDVIYKDGVPVKLNPKQAKLLNSKYGIARP